MKKQILQKEPDKRSIGKLTTNEQEREILYKKLMTNDSEGLRKMNIKQFDLNIFEPVQDMQFIDEEISPLTYCAFYGKADLAKLLFENKLLDCDLQTPSNKHTPLIVACLGSNYEMAKLLIDKGAEVNKPNLFFQTPLIYQSFEQNRICLRIAEMLISHGADPNWVFEKHKGYNLLHFLCSSSIKMNKAQKQLNYDLIKFLINHGANINQKTLTDKKAMDLLDPHCNAQAIRQLLIKTEQMKENKVMIKKNSEDSKIMVKKTKNLSDFHPGTGTTRSVNEGYSRNQQVQWYKNNLLNIHGIKKV